MKLVGTISGYDTKELPFVLDITDGCLDETLSSLTDLFYTYELGTTPTSINLPSPTTLNPLCNFY